MTSRTAAAVELLGTALTAVDRIDPAPRPTRKGMAQLTRAIAGAKMQLHGTAASNRALHVVGGAPSDAESQGVTGPLATADPIIAELEAALAMRRAGANAKTLRGKLRRVEEQLDEQAGRLGDLILGGLGPPVEPLRERLTGAAMNPLEQILEAFMERVRQVVREELAARAAPPATEMVSVATFAAEHSLCTATVRAMIRDGRLQATRVGKRAVRIRRDATIGQSANGRATPGAETPTAAAARILARLR